MPATDGPIPRSLTRRGRPWTVGGGWLGAGGRGIHALPRHAHTIDRKVEALLSHTSQLTDPDATSELVRGWAAMVAAAAGLPDGRYAEAVRVVNTR